MLQQMTHDEKVETLFRDTDTRAADRADTWFADQVRRARKEPFGVEGLLTPALAERLLRENPDNRSVSEISVQRIAQEIVEGQWKTNGETIIVSREGKLNDGQHRCEAVIRAGRAVKTAFWFGATRESRDTIDTGNARTVGDFLSMKGVMNANSVAASTRMLWQIDRYGGLVASPEKQPTKQDLLQYWHDNRDIEDSMHFVPTGGTEKLGGRSVLAAAHFLMRRRDPVSADYFIQRWVTGDGLQSKDPIGMGREWMRDKWADAKAGKREAKLSSHDKLEALFRVWNATREGRRMSKIQLMGTLPKLR